jgi:hypothetical protein
MSKITGRLTASNRIESEFDADTEARQPEVTTMPSQTLMLIGGVDNDDYEWLLQNDGQKEPWSCLKDAQVGDPVLIYVAAPHSQIIAAAHVLKPPVPGHKLSMKWPYAAIIGPIRLLASPIPLAEAKRLCPDWAWLNYPRHGAYIPSREAKTLLRRAQLKSPPVENADVEVTGAGFGDPETNRRVERAAVEAVKRYFKRKDYTVRSREQEKCGYDLEVRNGRSTLHVEVKGVSNGSLAFPITEGEVRCAKTDPQFRLAVVTEALTVKHRKIHLYSGQQFVRQFTRRPLAYMAQSR